MKKIFFTILVLTALGQGLLAEELTTYTAVTRGFGIKNITTELFMRLLTAAL